MIIFLKSIIVGLGGIAPGLSGSVLMIIFGLYQDVLNALGTLLVDFKNKIKFLFPIISGMIVGVLLFSKMLNFFLCNYEVPTRYLFLGLILGTIPVFYKEVKKKGFAAKYYIVILAAAIAGTWFFTINADLFPQILEPNFLQKIELGVAVAVSAIVPGIDPAVLLSTLGLYGIYVNALASFDLNILFPMVIGLAIGSVLVSLLISKLFEHFYTMTFSVIFGIFLSMIPNILNQKCYHALHMQATGCVIAVLVGFCISYYVGELEENNQKLKKWLKRGRDNEFNRSI